jgi:ribosome-binding factor A
MNHRLDKINGELKRVLAGVLREVKDPRISTMTTVTGVEATKDLKQAKVFVSVLGTEEQQKAALKGLHSAEGFIRRELGMNIDLHFTPQLTFVLDRSMETGAKIDKLIREAQKDDE